MIFAAEETTATTTTYANTRWKGPFCTVEPNTEMMPATMRIFDFYLMRGNKIFYNWMIIDTVDLMLQAGRRVLPKVKYFKIGVKIQHFLKRNNSDFSVSTKRGFCSSSQCNGRHSCSNF